MKLIFFYLGNRLNMSPKSRQVNQVSANKSELSKKWPKT